jgi:hypothetical protein
MLSEMLLIHGSNEGEIESQHYAHQIIKCWPNWKILIQKKYYSSWAFIIQVYAWCLGLEVSWKKYFLHPLISMPDYIFTCKETDIKSFTLFMGKWSTVKNLLHALATFPTTFLSPWAINKWIDISKSCTHQFCTSIYHKWIMNKPEKWFMNNPPKVLDH